MSTTATVTAPTSSSLSPLGRKAFAILWVATVVSNVGTWMNDVGAGWLITELSPSPATVALMQAATTLPVFLFALPAGALADIVDRRRLLIAVNLAMAATAATVAALVAAGAMTTELLLLFTFLVGAGAAFVAPAWQAIVPGLVSREELPAAVSLNSVGINVSRAVGPALAGVLIVAVGLWAPFLVNAMSFLGILAALWFWSGEAPRDGRLPPETLLPAMVAGLRYASQSRPLLRTLLRAIAFFLFASCYWAMLPLIAREMLGGGASLYGALMGAVGTGAVLGALVLPAARRRLDADGMVAAGTVATAATLVIFSRAPGETVAVGAAALGGFAWIAVLASLNVSAQTALPDWVRARGLSLFLMVFAGTMALGSMVWGQVAARAGIETALLVAGAGALIAIPLTWRARLATGEAPDHAPALHWPEPAWTLPEEAGDRRVVVQIGYRVQAAQQGDFTACMQDLAAARRRNGGYAWSLMQDTADTERFVEIWSEASWTQHLRHHARVTAAEKVLQDRLANLLAPGTAPEIYHLATPQAVALSKTPQQESKT